MFHHGVPSKSNILNLSHKVAIITGASSGIGAETAELFAKLGCESLVLVGRNEERLKDVCERCLKVGELKKTNVFCFCGDLTSDSIRSKLIQQTLDCYKQIDVLVNAAGVLVHNSVGTEGNLKEYDAVMDINVRAVFSLCELAVPHLKKTKGTIINVSSTFGERAARHNMLFCMSKAALDMFTKCLALELADFGIRVNSVNPSVVEGTLAELRNGSAASDLTQCCARKHPFGERCCDPNDVARAVAYLASDASSFITGHLLNVDGGFSL